MERQKVFEDPDALARAFIKGYEKEKNRSHSARGQRRAEKEQNEDPRQFYVTEDGYKYPIGPTRVW